MEIEGDKVEIICAKCGGVFHLTEGVHPSYDKCPRCGSIDITVGAAD